jgi:hypothetical protein
MNREIRGVEISCEHQIVEIRARHIRLKQRDLAIVGFPPGGTFISGTLARAGFIVIHEERQCLNARQNREPSHAAGRTSSPRRLKQCASVLDTSGCSERRLDTLAED